VYVAISFECASNSDCCVCCLLQLTLSFRWHHVLVPQKIFWPVHAVEKDDEIFQVNFQPAAEAVHDPATRRRRARSSSSSISISIICMPSRHVHFAELQAWSRSSIEVFSRNRSGLISSSVRVDYSALSVSLPLYAPAAT
jgi:hypothetical protein